MGEFQSSYNCVNLRKYNPKIFFFFFHQPRKTNGRPIRRIGRAGFVTARTQNSTTIQTSWWCGRARVDFRSIRDKLNHELNAGRVRDVATARDDDDDTDLGTRSGRGPGFVRPSSQRDRPRGQIV